MDKYIVITTLCNKEEIANKITNILLEKRLEDIKVRYGINSNIYKKAEILIDNLKRGD